RARARRRRAAGAAVERRARPRGPLHVGSHRPRDARGAGERDDQAARARVTAASMTIADRGEAGAAEGTPRADRRQRIRGYPARAVLAPLPPLMSQPGKVAADTKQYLYLDPSRLLGRAASMWDPNIGFGTVTHQNIGYLFPMGPYYWLMQALHVPDWTAERL